MTLSVVDVFVFFGFVVTVIAVGILMSRHERDSEAYFLAGRGLRWWLIGFSLIAANISTEQFVGQSGSAADYVGLAIASYEWLASITLVAVAFLFLPTFLRAGIYTMPEFLEYRYSRLARTLMSLCMMVIYVGVTIAAVLYSGAKTVDTLFSGTELAFGLRVNMVTASWMIGLLAAVYVVCGGLKACAWADLLQGSALILGGAIILVLALQTLGRAPVESLGLPANLADAGGAARFLALNRQKLHMVLPRTDLNVPWTALLIGLWIPNFYYWGFNQYITQRTLGSHSLGEGQKGIVFAAGLKLLIPFIVIFPGMIAFNLFHEEMRSEAEQKINQETLATLARVQTQPGDARIAFAFDAHFARLHPDTARALVAFNSRVAGVELPPAAALAEANAQLLDTIRQQDQARAGQAPVEIQQKLVGYDFDAAFPLLIKKLVPMAGWAGLQGFMLAAILGAVISTLAAMLNAASTIFTIDLYQGYVNPGASQTNLVLTGRLAVAAFAAVGCLIAPLLGDPRFGGIFKYIQEFQGFIEPGILGVFLFGVFVPRAPRSCGAVALILSPIGYGILMVAVPDLAFLDRIAVDFGLVLVVMTVLTLLRPLPEPLRLPEQTKIKLDSSPGAKLCGGLVVAVTIALYIIFW